MLKRLFRKEQDEDDMPCSIVMLLRSPFAMSKEVLEVAASRAYGMPYDGSQQMYFVFQQPQLTLVKAGNIAIKLLQIGRPYFDDHESVAQGFEDARLRSAWIQHRGWAAFDVMNEGLSKKEAYRALAPLIAELIDARCAGIYLPKDRLFTIQSDGSAATHLRKLRR